MTPLQQQNETDLLALQSRVIAGEVIPAPEYADIVHRLVAMRRAAIAKTASRNVRHEVDLGAIIAQVQQSNG